MKKEIKEILSDDLKALTLKFDFIEDTREDVRFPINPFLVCWFFKIECGNLYLYVFQLIKS